MNDLDSGGFKDCGKLHSSAHAFGESNMHLQFTPKKRRRVFLDAGLRNACKQCFAAKASELGVNVLALEFGPEHVHLFVGGCKNYSVPVLAQHFKGYSARVLRQQFSVYLERFKQGASFWSDGYFYESVGRVTSETVKFYIERHKKKHWAHEDYDPYCRLSSKQNGIQTTLGSFNA